MYQAVLFDMDGLLIDTEPITINARMALGAQKGLPITREMAEAVVGMSQKHVDSYFTHLFGDRYVHQDFIDYRREQLLAMVHSSGIPFKAGARELLNYLSQKGIRKMIVTSTSRIILDDYRASEPLFALFDGFVTGEDVKEGKPHPDIYLFAAAKLGLDPSKCLALEDSKNGIIAGRASGMDVIMIPDLIPPDQDIKDLGVTILPSLNAVIPWLEALSVK